MLATVVRSLFQMQYFPKWFLINLTSNATFDKKVFESVWFQRQYLPKRFISIWPQMEISKKEFNICLVTNEQRYMIWLKYFLKVFPIYYYTPTAKCFSLYFFQFRKEMSHFLTNLFIRTLLKFWGKGVIANVALKWLIFLCTKDNILL